VRPEMTCKIVTLLPVFTDVREDKRLLMTEIRKERVL
jgi:hypothetical protein